ncbi:MAG: hypothetical protein ABI085_01190 [Gemmatimonadaceae bacterium]
MATIDASGMVAAIKPGSTYVVVTLVNQGRTFADSISVTVGGV